MRISFILLCLLPYFLVAQIVLQDDGKIGIGTENPNFQFEINSENIRIGDSNNKRSWLLGDLGFANLAGLKNAHITGAKKYALLQHHNGVTILNAAASRYISFRIENNVKMHLDAFGKLGIGTGAGALTEKLHVNGTVVANNLDIVSDRRLKSNIQTFNRGLDELIRLQPITYKYNGKAGQSGNKTQVGIIAQELQKLAPELVSDFTYTVADDNGNESQAESYLKVNDTGIKYMMINAIIEQQTIIDKQNSDLAKLYETVESLIDEVESLNEKLEHTETVQVIGVNGEGKIASLSQNTPNPFNGSTQINYFIPVSSRNASVRMLDQSGRMLSEEQINSFGQGTLEYDLNDMPAGKYFYSLIVDGIMVETKSMSVIK